MSGFSMIVPFGDFGDLAVCGIDEKLPKMGAADEDMVSVVERFLGRNNY